jgi:hypothetical protein
MHLAHRNHKICQESHEEGERRVSPQCAIEVVADWVGLPGPTRMGYLTATPAHGKEVFSFE